MYRSWQNPKRAGELRGKEIGGLPWAKHIKKYPQDLRKLQNIRVMAEGEVFRGPRGPAAITGAEFEGVEGERPDGNEPLLAN